jgi:large subunit ribosomal protein L5
MVCCGIGSLHTRKGIKDFTEIENNLKAITGQKPVLINAKKSVSNFKLREGSPVMLKVTLRREKAYDFIEKLVHFVLPRVRDFNGLNEKSFDK